MNKKITVRRADGKVRYCILTGDGDLQEQLNLWYFGATHPGGGYSVSFSGDRISIVDSIAYDTVATFEVLSVEDTDDAPSPHWINPETLQTGWD